MPYLATGELRDGVDLLAENGSVLTPEECGLRLRELSHDAAWGFARALETPGALNRYACQLYCRAAPQNYAAKKEWCGQILLAGIQAQDTDLLAAALEIYRVDIGPYEDAKRAANGDLDWPTLKRS